MRTVSVQNMRRLEAAAVDDGTTYIQLMENAGTAASRAITDRYAMQGMRVAVLCGSGNNGGDGYVIARLLALRGAAVTVVQTDGAPRTPDAAYMAELVDRAAVPFLNLQTEPYLVAGEVKAASLVVDAVYGIGFHGSLPDALRPLFRVINENDTPVASIDAPSGVNVQTGEYDPDALRATFTVTFTAAKPAMKQAALAPFLGKLLVVSVGISEELIALYAENEREIDWQAVNACFSPRPLDCNKGSFGRLLCVCGSFGMAGAALMAGKAALRCGLGLLDMALPRSIYPVAAGQLCEAVFLPLPETLHGTAGEAALPMLKERLSLCRAALIGCGLSQHPQTAQLVLRLLSELSVPAVVDADGLNALAAHKMEWKAGNAPLVLTPHPGEMARLADMTVEQVQADRVGVARRFAVQHGVVLVLKGHRTVIACPDGQVMINPTGCAGMATGGSGDVLAGMIASFLAQGFLPEQAAMCGIYLHGLAGERAAKRLSQTAMLPSDLIEELPFLFLQIEKQE